MNRRVLSVALLLSGCAPTQPAATTGCESLAECPLDQVCDRSVRQCIPEPANRFLGAFSCTVTDTTTSANLELSEVVGHIGDDRFSLPSVFCFVRAARSATDVDTLTLGFSAPATGLHLTVHVASKDAATHHVTIKPLFETGINAASMENGDSFTEYGTSASGKVDFATTPTLGKVVDGYLDIKMTPAVSADALFGASCPRGRADCGDKTMEAGGVALCSTVLNGPACISVCKGNGDCSIGNGVCVQGVCTKACTSHADCTAPLRCTQGNAGESNGCF